MYIMDEAMGDAAGHSPGHEALEQMSSHLDSVKVKEEVRVKKEFKLNDLEGQRRSAFMTYKPAATILTNLQRGNVQAEVPSVEPCQLTLHQRAGMGDLTAADLQDVANVDESDDMGYSALMWASAYGQVPTVRLLLEHKANSARLGPDGETPLILATSSGHYEIVRLLINAGADVNHADENGNTALMYAAFSNSPHAVNELLFSGADVAATNINGESALSIAVQRASQLAQVVLERYLMSKVLPALKDSVPDTVGETR
ncbi:ankyrin repeat family A protein 2-like isoform X3 [Amphibalanus amphitrite]|uniref:ankyrin repeat family A protein 2-like isoform X3 n=1 Tax=Amphibalanus amphitrite TaxID=1232801 RepID=UPI001C9089AE|nr:ankyrin repeat family A protein 2-like isoform X3 [Amphibalanus amphitrite]